eukprot:3344370-Pyramimonas_sp.AAC.1
MDHSPFVVVVKTVRCAIGRSINYPETPGTENQETPDPYPRKPQPGLIYSPCPSCLGGTPIWLARLD